MRSVLNTTNLFHFKLRALSKSRSTSSKRDRDSKTKVAQTTSVAKSTGQSSISFFKSLSLAGATVGKPKMLSPEVQKGVDDAREMLLSTQRPWIGTSLRRARISKTLTELHVIENNSCKSEMDLGYARANILYAQCISISDLCNVDMVKRDIPQLVYLVEEALLTWAWLFDHSQYQQSDSAIQLRGAMSNLLTVNSATLSRQDMLHGVQTKLTRLSRSCKDPFVAAFHLEVTHAILEECFHTSIKLFEEGRWAPAMSLLKSKDSELDVLIEFEDRNATQSQNQDDYSEWGLSGDRYEEGRAGMLRRDFDMQMAMCKGSQLIHMGDLQFKEAMNGDPDDMMARALLAQDDYCAALGWVTGQEVELEGSALTRLARFHSKITKMPVSAHALYLRAVQLAAALQPAFPKGDWYKESTKAVQAYRDALQAEESKKWEKLREPILEKLSGDIVKLNGAKDMGNFEFAKFVYKTWPPKTDGAAEPPIDPEDPNTLSKKHLLKVIQRYHSDKNITWGDEWRVMSEEISKCFTDRYNVMKGV